LQWLLLLNNNNHNTPLAVALSVLLLLLATPPARHLQNTVLFAARGHAQRGSGIAAAAAAVAAASGQPPTCHVQTVCLSTCPRSRAAAACHDQNPSRSSGGEKSQEVHLLEALAAAHYSLQSVPGSCGSG
jgi:hypothetical protein